MCRLRANRLVLLWLATVACSELEPLSVSPDGGAGAAGHAGELADASDAGSTEDNTVDAHEEPAEVGPLLGLAFDLTLTDEPAGPWCEGVCLPAMITVIDEQPDRLTLVWGRTGAAETVQLHRIKQGWLLEQPLVLGSHPAPFMMCPHQSELTSAVFEFSDTDGDGQAELEIQGHVETSSCEDDYEVYYGFSIAFQGRLNERRPTLADADVPLNPIEPIRFLFDAPMLPQATAFLEDMNGNFVVTLDRHSGLPPYVVGFDTERVLPLQTSYRVRFNGEDLGGAGTPLPVEVRTIDDFGVLVEDGFESGSTEGILTSNPGPHLEIFEQWGDIPPISGSRSLYVARSAMFRLQGTGGSATLAMRCRLITNDASRTATLTLTVAKVGRNGRMVEWHNAQNPTKMSGPSNFVLVGDVQDIEVPLASETTDVYVAVEMAEHSAISGVDESLILDDLRLE